MRNRDGWSSTWKPSAWMHKRLTRCTSCSPARATCGTARATSCNSTPAMYRHTYSGCAAACAPNATSTTSSDPGSMDQLANSTTTAPETSPMGASSPVSVPAPTTWEDDPLWFKDAIVYELPVKAFFDSNNDGMGDLRGLTAKLD